MPWAFSWHPLYNKYIEAHPATFCFHLKAGNILQGQPRVTEDMTLSIVIPKLAFLGVFTVLLHSRGTSATSLTDWLHNPPYRHGTLVEEIQCYSLPYGGIGFASHIITYYTIAMLALQLHPYAPWRRNKNSGFDLFLATVGLIATIIISSLTMVRCRSRWQFVAIAAWKLDLSVTFGFLSLHAAAMLPKSARYDWDEYTGGHGDAAKVLFWLILYIPGVIAGMAGLLSLVAETINSNHNIMIVTAVFGAVTLAAALLVGIIVCCLSLESSVRIIGSGLTSLFVILGCFGVLGAFYSDWILAAIAENMSGTPSPDNAALYWSYFVAKRLPFFSS